MNKIKNDISEINKDKKNTNDIEDNGNINYSEEESLNKKIHDYWENDETFEKQNKVIKNKTFYFYDGPPFMTGDPHYGHILAGSIKDTITRHQYSKGFNVPRLMGIDCHGLPIEYEIEKELKIKTTKEILDYGIKNYNNKCKEIILRCKDNWERITKKLGRWVDYKNGYMTISKNFMNSVWWVFSELYKKGRIYEGVRIMPYSTACATPLSNFETSQNYKEINDDSLYLKFKVDSESYLWCNNYDNCYFIVWTTTPWTLPSNYLLAINKNFNYNTVPYFNKDTQLKELLIVAENLVDDIINLLKIPQGLKSIHSLRGEELIGLKYIPPFNYNNLHKEYYVVHGDFVSDITGTGIVHIAPNHGTDDYKVCLENNLINKESKLFNTLNENGYVNKNIPVIEGIFYKNNKDKKNEKNEMHEDLNTWVVKKIKDKGLYLIKKTIKHSYPFCWRSDTPLIYKATSSYFVKVEDMAEKLVNLNESINWIPKNVGEKRFKSWISNSRDWGITRNRFWGTPIPIWKSKDGDEICVSSSYELEELLKLSPGSIEDLHRDNIDNFIIVKDGKEYKRINDVLDCWFESGSMPYGSLSGIGIVELLRNSKNKIEYDENNYPYIKTKDDKVHKILPADFIAEGLDQTRGWFYTLLVLSASLFNKIPFKNVIVNGIILAENGEKMSKRLKNYPDVEKVLDENYPDCLRMYLIGSNASLGEPLKFNKDDLKIIMKDVMIKIKNGSINFFKEYSTLYYEKNKTKPLTNLFKEEIYKKYKNPLVLWFLKKYNDYRNEFFYYMDNYNLRHSVKVIFKVIEDLNNGFIKIGRNLLKGNDSNINCLESLNTLNYILISIANDFKSIMPYMCEFINLELFKINLNLDEDFYYLNEQKYSSVHLNEYKKYIPLDINQINLANEFDIIYEIIKKIYGIRSKNNKSLKKPIKKLYLVVDENIKSYVNEEYFDYIYEECNIIELKKTEENDIKINKIYKPVQSLFFKKHGKEIKNTLDEISKKNNEELEKIIENKVYNNFEISLGEFNIEYKIEFNKLQDHNDNTKLVIDEIKLHNHKIFIIVDIVDDEMTDKLYYAKLFATTIQRFRKNAGLHPWNKIKIYYHGEQKYEFNQEMKDLINKTVKMEIFPYEKKYDDKIFYKEFCDKINLNIFFENIS